MSRLFSHLKIQHIYRDGGELSTRELQKMVQALPQYSEQIDKLSLHVEVSFLSEKSFHLLLQREEAICFCFQPSMVPTFFIPLNDQVFCHTCIEFLDTTFLYLAL